MVRDPRRISMTKQIGDASIEEDGNMQFKGYLLE